MVETERDIVQGLPFKKVHVIESNYFLCNRYQGRGIVVCEDIRNLPYPYDMFDMILDLSTIDHIPMKDALHVLDKYYGCLKTGGVLVLLYTHRQFWHWLRKLKDNGVQYYFNGMFRDEVRRLFDVKEEYDVGTLQVAPFVSRVFKHYQRLLPYMVRLEYVLGVGLFSEQHLMIGVKN